MERKDETSLHARVGFDYAQAMKDLLKRLTHMEIAFRIGYQSTGSVTAVVKGVIPSHKHGEALWALYMEVFGTKPPMSEIQSNDQRNKQSIPQGVKCAAGST